MAKRPNSNLPASALPWGRNVEDALDSLVAENRQLQADLVAERYVNITQASQLEQLQNYVRKICELAGFDYPPASAPTPPDPVVVPPPVVPITEEFNATWSATWYQGFKRTSVTNSYDDALSMFQRGSGYAFAMAGFDLNRVRGKNVTKVELWLQNISTYYNGPFTAILGTHDYDSEPASRPYVGRQNGFDVGWNAGLGQWVNMGPWIYSAISNGTITGITTGDGGRDNQNFARFAGVGRVGAPKLRITYNG